MGKQMTEMLKGTLEGIVLAILAVQPAYGYEITARLREQGFSDIVEGTVYALLVRIEQRGLVDVEKVPSEKGPPRKVYSLNANGRASSSRSSGGPGASSRNGSNSSTTSSTSGKKERSNYGRQVDRDPHRVARAEEAVQAVQGPHRGPARAVRHRRAGVPPVLHVLRRHHRRRHPHARCSATSPTSGSAPPPTGRRVREIVGDDPVEFAETFAQAYSGKRWIDKERARLTKAIEDAEREEQT